MQKKLLSLLIVTVFIVISTLAGCSSEKTTTAQESATAAQETTAVETTQEVQETETTAAAMAEEEILFDSYTIPSDWPKAVPLHGEMKVTKYERTENSMIASGFCKYDVIGLNNFYTNAQKKIGGGYPWEFDSGKESVTQGTDQVFYFVSEEGQSLTIKFSEVEERLLTFEFDYKE